MIEFGEVEAFGTRLKEGRGAKPRSLFATKCHVSVSTIVIWEDGRGLPSKDKLLEISVAYDISMAELVATMKTSRDARQREIAGRRPLKVRKVDTRVAFYSKFNSGAGTGA
jgi:transcriptional regulator with XRE-family HTH domain